MQIVINIDEEIYKRILPYKDVPVISNLANDYPELMHAIANGTPLPKGALITKGQTVELVEFYKLNPQHFSFDNLIDDIHNEKPIIEADKVENEEHEEIH